MKQKRHLAALVAGALALYWSGAATAGPYSDDLTKCLVGTTTPQDRVALVQWMVSAALLHPAVKPFASVSAEQLDLANKRTADLFLKVLTESCRQESVAVLKYEGLPALQSSFQILGQIAGQELFSSPEVTAGMAGMKKYFDDERLRSLVESAQ